MMTNADKIRSMTDEELETFLSKILNSGIEWFWAWSCNICKAEHDGTCPSGEYGGCIKMDGEIQDWLKAEAEN